MHDQPKRAVIYCCCCNRLQSCSMVTGSDIYGPDTKYAWTYFYRCPDCGGYVGVSHTYEPLGTIPTPEIRALRMQIHNVIDPLWRTGKLKRTEVYRQMTKLLGCGEYHTALLSTVEVAEKALEAAKLLANKYEDKDEPMSL